MMRLLLPARLALACLLLAWAPAHAHEDAAPVSCKVLDPELQQSYTGDCLNGWADGQGLARGAQGAWYRGGFKAGRKSGHGVKLYPNGDAYTGDWANDMRNGEGRYEYGPHSPWRGDAYQGGWRDDKRDGQGTYIFFPSGDRFTATWVANGTDTVGTATITRRKRVAEVLAPVLGKPGTHVCSVTTEGASPQRMAQGVVTDMLDDRLQVRLDSPAVLQHSTDPTLNPRWESITDWILCPTP